MRLIDADYILSSLNVFSDREHGNEHFLFGIETAQDIVKDAPTIEPRPHWIPFTLREETTEDGLDQKESPMISCEELPENGQDILVTDGYRVWIDTFFDDNGLYLDSENALFWDVIAWMPLPEPYTEKEDSNDGV